MRRAIPLFLLAVGWIAGCEPAPSTKLAPEQKLPDVSKMPSDQVDEMLKGDRAGNRR
jgi:hypothetical protein